MMAALLTSLGISIHAPREGGDRGVGVGAEGKARFQSTPPARGATTQNREQHHRHAISIHAPREGGDCH